MQGDGIGQDLPAGWPDDAVWRRSRLVEVATEESERFLDLAGFADGQLDPDDRNRVAEWLDRDPIALGDVAAACQLASTAERLGEAPASVVARASALVGRDVRQPGNVIAFPVRPRYAPGLGDLARWSSVAAAMAVAAWLGFALGTDTSRSVARIGQSSEDALLQDLLDPSIGFMRDLSESART